MNIRKRLLIGLGFAAVAAVVGTAVLLRQNREPSGSDPLQSTPETNSDRSAPHPVELAGRMSDRDSQVAREGSAAAMVNVPEHSPAGEGQHSAADQVAARTPDRELTEEQREYLGNWAVIAGRFRLQNPGPMHGMPRRIRRTADDAHMVLVQSGEFLMGRGYSGVPPESVAEDTKPDVRVRLSRAFFMDETEVTVGQWRIYAKAAGGAVPPASPQLEASLPMVGISHADATVYARWASVQLPTEAQWECAARVSRTVNALYPYDGEVGNADALRFWTGERSNGPRRVARYAPNYWGLYDLGGNAAEWCRDMYRPDYYKLPLGNPRLDPLCSPGSAELELTSVEHLVRGGSWYSPKEQMRVFHRSHAGTEISGIGFRCVKEVPWRIDSVNSAWEREER